MTEHTAPAPETMLQRWQRCSTPFTETVDGVEQWDADSPCEGWTARDVLEHVLTTQRDFLHRQGHELAANDHEEPAARWAAHVRAVEALLADPSVAEEPFDGYFGPTTVGATLVEFYGFDLLVHRWDLGRSQGHDVRFSADELVTIDTAVDGWGEHAYAPGIFASPAPVPEGAEEQTRVLARTGRRA